MRRSLVLAAAFLVVTLVAVLVQEARRPAEQSLTPTLTGETEYCLTCHADLAQISQSHPLQSFGCVLCHGGERLALNADLAHSTLRGGKNPSDLSVVQESCGGENCHSGAAEQHKDHIQRVQTSLQATYAGAIAQMRYAYGAQEDLTPRMGIFAVRGEEGTSDKSVPALEAFDPAVETNPALASFGRNCLTCHLSAEPRPGTEFARYTDCAACHTPMAGRKVLMTEHTQTDSAVPIHKLSLAIPYTQCNTCHNRGNYSTVDMQFHPRQDQPAGRLQDYYQPVAQFTRCEWELDCVDCHTRQEAMGDGKIYGKMKDIQYIQCRTCHGTLNQPPSTRTILSDDDFALNRAFLNPVIDLKVGDTILTSTHAEDIWNVRRRTDGVVELYAKASGLRYEVPQVMGSACEQKEDQQTSADCHACHAVERQP